MSTDISINQLPEIREINNNDLLIVQTPTSTNTLRYRNFVIGIDNTTFGQTILSNSTRISQLSGILDNQFFNNEELETSNTPEILIKAGGSSFTVQSRLLPINITTGGTTQEYFMLLARKADIDNPTPSDVLFSAADIQDNEIKNNMIESLNGSKLANNTVSSDKLAITAGTPTTATSPLTSATHFVVINFNGTNYRLHLSPNV